MEAIRNYVDALFAALPQNADTQRIKADMLANLEEKYQVLLDEGKNEAEATGLVISSIGSADDLREEFDMPANLPAVLPSGNALSNRFIFGLFLLTMVPLVMIAAFLCFSSTLMTNGQVWWLVKYTVGGIVAVTLLYQLACFMTLRQRVSLRHSLLFLSISLPIACVLYIFLCSWYGLRWEIPLAYFPICCLIAIALEYIERTTLYPISRQ